MFYMLFIPHGLYTELDFIEVTDDLDFYNVINCDFLEFIYKDNFALIVDDEFLFKPSLLPNLPASNLYNGLIYGNAILAKYNSGSQDIEPFNTISEAISFFEDIKPIPSVIHFDDFIY